jgi:hypothetical protein
MLRVLRECLLLLLLLPKLAEIGLLESLVFTLDARSLDLGISLSRIALPIVPPVEERSCLRSLLFAHV